MNKTLMYNLIKEILAEELSKKLLTEADLTKVNQSWLGAYAFVLAYNDSLAAGLFPRSQPMRIEFEEKIPIPQKGLFKNGTLYLNPFSVADKDFFLSGPGHDFLHGLTQNIQQHFGNIKNWSDKEFEKYKTTRGVGDSQKKDSKVNLKKIDYKDLKKFIAYAKKEFNVDFDQLFPEKSPEEIRKTMPKELDRDSLRDKVRAELVADRLQRIKKIKTYIEDTEDGETNLKSLGREALKLRNYFEQMFNDKAEPYIDPGDRGHAWPMSKENPTHAIEENMGNIISDELAGPISASSPIDASAIKTIEEELKYYQYRAEKMPADADKAGAGSMYTKWLERLLTLMPEFAKRYNNRLATLKKTSFGANQVNQNQK